MRLLFDTLEQRSNKSALNNESKYTHTLEHKRRDNKKRTVNRLNKRSRGFLLLIYSVRKPIFFLFFLKPSCRRRSAVQAEGISVLASVSSYLLFITQALLPENTQICVIMCLNIIHRGNYNHILF